MKERTGGIELLEEAISLVRIAPARAWTWYLAGAVPFFATSLFFLRVTTGALAVPDPTGWSLALAILFGWRQLSRSMYGRILTGEIRGSGTATNGAWSRVIVRTWFAGFLRMAVPLPVPWLSIFFRNYQAYAWDEEPAFLRATATSSHGGVPVTSWLTLGAISVCVFLNVLMGMVMIPTLYRIFTGEDAEFTRNVGALLNRTAVFAALMIAWCLCDIVFEAMCALQRFYSESETTGADLMRAWHKAIGKAAIQIAAALAIAFAIPTALHAQQPQTLDKAIDQVLSEKQYQWREAPTVSTDSDSAIVRWMRSVVRAVQRWIRSVTRPLKRWWDAFWRWLLGPGQSLDSKGPAPPVDTLHLALVLVIVLLGGALVALLLRTGIRTRTQSAALPSAQSTTIDLNDPAIAATDLAEEEWLRLAREWTEKGDPRMALRAWFLACLAWLNTREFVSISRNKSNLDYRRELARRARAIPGMAEQFTACVRRFDSAWYGLYPLDFDEVERFAAGIRQMRSLAG